MKKIYLLIVVSVCMVNMIDAQRKFVHPGITYTQADLDRMKAMVTAKQEPFYSTYQALLASEYSQIGDGNYSDVTQIQEGEFNGTIGRDGRRAHDLALLYHITGNNAYADDAVKRLNRYKNLTNASGRGTAPLDNGKLYLLLEAAELLRDYDGWLPEDQAAFKRMLVHPFYSTTVDASATNKHWTDDSQNNVTFYWNIYNFDASRWGNQGLFAARSLLAMGIFLDNDTIYDRAYRYLNALPARTDDLHYSLLPVKGSEKSNNGYFIEYNISWSRPDDVISDEALPYYIYQNGQCQESCRDQSHVLAGIGNYTAIAEMAWSQGDTLYSALDNRILTGIEYNLRYNLSYMKSYSDQTTPWETSASSKSESDCTYENGVFYQALSRSYRWEAIKISDQARGASPEGWLTQALQHYKIRGGLPAQNYLWLERSYDNMYGTTEIEDWGVPPSWYYEWTGWGTLTKYRTVWMAGAPGTWVNGEWIPGMSMAPATINAVDYDYYSKAIAEGHTYHNNSTIKNTVYRNDGTVEIENVGGDYVLSSLETGEWLNYTIGIPISGNYDIYITYTASATTSVSAAVDNGTPVDGALPATTVSTEAKIGGLDFIGGASVLRLTVTGAGNVLKIKNIRIEYAPVGEQKVNFSGTLTSTGAYVMKWDFENILFDEVNVVRATSNDVSSAVVISSNNLLGDYTDKAISGDIPQYYYWIQYTEKGDNTVYYSEPVTFQWGYLYDSFVDTNTENAIWTVSGYGTGIVDNDALEISYTDARAYYRRTEQFSFHGGNYPILAFCMDKPANSTIALHSSSSKKFGGEADKYTGKIGDQVYYYDLTTNVFKTSGSATTGDAVPLNGILTVNPIQIRQTVSDNTDSPTKLYWVGTFKSVTELQQHVTSVTENKQQDVLNYFTKDNTVYFTSLPADATVTIYNINGQKVGTSNCSSTPCGITLPVRGLYIVQLVFQGNIQSFKLIL